MKTAVTMFLFLVLAAACAAAQPKVDGRVTPGEYSRSISVVDGAATVYYQFDAGGGLSVAVSAATTGWVGIGLGSSVMDGAHIFMGYVKNGATVFSEQIGTGHSHHESRDRSADSSAVSQAGGTTTIEFHVPAGKVPLTGTTVPFIVAFSGSPDLSTYHEDTRDGGTMEKTAP
jgi:DOMON domain